MSFKNYAVLITIICEGKEYYYDRLITARTHKEACKVANKIASTVEKKQCQNRAIERTIIKVLGV